MKKGGNKLRVLVTGGAGFIGSHTVNYLIKAGDEVLVVDDLSRGHVIPTLPARWLHTDIFSKSLEDEWRKFQPEVVLHLAAQVDVETSWECTRDDLRTNVEGTLRLLELIHSQGSARMVLASSAAVYGSITGELTEETPVRPCSPYGLGKRMAEDYLALLANRWNIPWLVLRYANVYGPYSQDENPMGVCRVFAQALKQELPLIINGSGRQTRDFVSVYDVARANYLACHSDLSEETFNISAGVGYSILDVLEGLTEASQQQPIVHVIEEGPVGVEHSILSPLRAKHRLQWETEWNLKEGLRDLWKSVQLERKAL